VPPLATAAEKVKVPLLLTVKLFPALSCNTTEPESPVMEPPTMYVLIVQFT
jgi:hypothetical protein